MFSGRTFARASHAAVRGVLLDECSLRQDFGLELLAGPSAFARRHRKALA